MDALDRHMLTLAKARGAVLLKRLDEAGEQRLIPCQLVAWHVPELVRRSVGAQRARVLFASGAMRTVRQSEIVLPESEPEE
jgi:hypothetical protein